MRAAVTVSVSMPPADLKMAEHLAKSTNRSVSGVLREGLKRLASDQYWRRVHETSQPKATALGVTQRDVPRLVKEYRSEKRAKTAKKKAR
jgi:hypothetical protein